MPPEYLLQGIVTPKSDIFSLGVIIMEVITGHRDYPYDITTSSKCFIDDVRKNSLNSRDQSPMSYRPYVAFHHCVLIFYFFVPTFAGTSKMEECAAKKTRVYITRNRLTTNKKMHRGRSNLCES